MVILTSATRVPESLAPAVRQQGEATNQRANTSSTRTGSPTASAVPLARSLLLESSFIASSIKVFWCIDICLLSVALCTGVAPPSTVRVTTGQQSYYRTNPQAPRHLHQNPADAGTARLRALKTVLLLFACFESDGSHFGTHVQSLYHSHMP